MTTTVIGTIDDARTARKLIDELVEAGFKEQDVELLDGPEQEVLARIVERGFGEDDARGYAQAVRRGKVLVAARAPDRKVDQAVAIVERHENAGAAEGATERGETVREAEEELSVGKRKVATGGVRVTTSVREQPVEETVTLREEHVTAERQPVDRELSAAEAEGVFQGKTVEMMGTREEAEASKQARVVGEVTLGKQVAERAETVKDTVRRSGVAVEETGAKPRKGSR
jgi:uncharacterized protein (TIGR02271 family)